MKAHNLEIIGRLSLNYTPEQPNDAVRLQDLDNIASSGKAAFITNVEPSGSGNVGDKQYAPSVPANQVIQSCTTDTADVRIHFLVESGPSSYSPTITIDGEPVDHMEEASGDRRLFTGYKDVTLVESGIVELSSSTGAKSQVDITLATEGPVVQSLSVDSLPGSQTAVKQGDVISVSGTVANTAASIEVVNSGAGASGSFNLGLVDSGGAGLRSFTGTVVASNRTGTKPIEVRALNQLNTPGDSFFSDLIAMDQVYPSVSAIVNYNNGLSALAEGETASVALNTTAADSVQFDFDHGTYQIDSAGTDPAYTVTAAANVYSMSGGVHVTVHKNANGASTTRQFTVAVASALPSAHVSIEGVSGSIPKLRSSLAGETYYVRVSSDQNINGSPSLTPSAGTWSGAWQKLNASTWRRPLFIEDSTVRGTASFSGLSIVNPAGLIKNSIDSGEQYEIAGFELREITYPAFAQFAPIGTAISNPANTQVRYAGTSTDLTYRTDKNNVQGAYTFVDENGDLALTGGTHLWLNDADFAASNTSGTLKVEIEETT